MGLILDSDHLILAERRRFTAVQALTQLAAQSPGEQFGISAITLAELRHGVQRAATPDRRVLRQRFLDDLMMVTKVYPVTASIALLVGELDAELEMSGNKTGLADLIVGCTALEQDFGVATMNVRHFERIPGLRIVNLIGRR